MVEVPDLRTEATAVLRHVGPDGRLDDDASPELKRVRHAVARVGERLRRQLESFVHDPAAATVVRDAFVTQRNGRFVVPLRADAPKQVRGIVHGASSSGATLFVEPMESVELNNELVRLTEQELEEQERVLRGWADRFRQKLPQVRAALQAVVRVDTLQARALWGRTLPPPPPPSWRRMRASTSPSCGTRSWTGTCGRPGQASVPLTIRSEAATGSSSSPAPTPEGRPWP
jgi:DNA mismatch repair protein MutS2